MGYKWVMNDYRTLLLLVSLLLLSSWVVKGWADFVQCESKVGRWALGVMASAFSVMWVACMVGLIGCAAGWF